MIYIFISAMLGFFVFDAYRVRLTKKRTGRLEVISGDKTELIAHLAIYPAAGVLALFVNLDVLGSCCEYRLLPVFNDSLQMPMARAFGIGVLGPAAISKFKTSNVSENDDGIGDVSGTEMSTLGKVKRSFRRVLMR